MQSVSVVAVYTVCMLMLLSCWPICIKVTEKVHSEKLYFFLSTAQQPPVGQGLLITEASRSHSDKPQSEGLLWTSDQPDSETSSWQNTTITTDKHPCLSRYSNPQSQRVAADPRLRPHGHWGSARTFVYM